MTTGKHDYQNLLDPENLLPSMPTRVLITPVWIAFEEWTREGTHSAGLDETVVPSNLHGTDGFITVTAD